MRAFDWYQNQRPRVTSKRHSRSVIPEMPQNWQNMTVTLKYRDQGRNESKIIQQLISLVFSVWKPQHHGSTSNGTPWNFGWNSYTAHDVLHTWYSFAFKSAFKRNLVWTCFIESWL